MSIGHRFSEVCARAQDRTSEEMTYVAYAGRQAMYDLYRDEEVGPMFMRFGRNEPIQCVGFSLLEDKDSPEVELIKFFIDGAHLFTLNTETDQLTEITPSDDEATVWQLAALGRYFNGNEAVPTDAPILRVYRPIRAYDYSDKIEDEPVISKMIVDLSEMANKGVLRREQDRYARPVYRMTHQGRIACSAAMHFSATYQAKSKSEFKAINRALMEM